MAPIDYSRFDDIDTSSSDDDEDGDETELEAGDAPPIDQLFDFFRARRAEEMPMLSRVGLVTETQARAMYRASDPLNNEDARPRRRRVALVKDDPNDAFFPPIFTERKKSNSRATEKEKTRRKKEPCAACGTRTRKRCGGCHKLGIHTPYCGASCQNAHWPTHRRACGERHPEIVARNASNASPIPDALDEAFGRDDATGGRTQLSCNQACAARDAHALAEALRAGRGAAPDADTCEIAAAWNAVECLRLLHAYGCEMNKAACFVTAVRYGARDCVLWLKDGVLFPPPTGPPPTGGWDLPPLPRMHAFMEELRDAAMPHVASPLRTAFERANRIERDFASVKGFTMGVIREALLCGSNAEPARLDPFADDFEPGPDFDEEDVQGVDPLVMRFPAGAIDAPPGYEVVDAWGIY